MAGVRNRYLLLAAAALACRAPSAGPAGSRGVAAPLWSAPITAGANPASGPAVAADGTVFIGGSIDATTGDAGPPAPGGSIRQPCLLAFDSDGRLRTKVPGSKPTGWTTGAPAMWVMLAPWGTAYAVDHSGGLYAIFPTGETLFRQVEGLTIGGPPALGPGGRIYVGGPGGLRGLDLQAVGSPVGFFFDLDRSHAFAPAASADGRLYFGTSYGGRLVALDPAGRSAWVRRSASGLLAVDPEGNPLAATDKTLTAYHPGGEPRWTFEAKSPLGQPVVGPDGTAYVCSQTGLVHALDKLGRERWSFALDGAAASVPTLGPDGTLYVSSQSGTLYGLDGEGKKRFTLAIPAGSGRVGVGPEGRIHFVADWRLQAYAPP